MVPLARYLGADEAIATRAEIDADGRYTGRVEFYAYGPFKADAVREAADRLGIDLEGSYAYSDSVTDVPMLAAVGHPVVVNPDRELRRIATEREWEIRVFTRPVPLRSRVRIAAAPAAAAGAGSLFVLCAAIGGWWWLFRRARQA